MTAKVTGRVVTAGGDGVNAVVSLSPLDLPQAVAAAGRTLVIGAPVHTHADDQGEVELEALPGRYRLRLLVAGADVTSTDVVLADGASYDLAALLGLVAGTGGGDTGGAAGASIVLSEDGLLMTITGATVSGDGATITIDSMTQEQP